MAKHDDSWYIYIYIISMVYSIDNNIMIIMMILIKKHHVSNDDNNDDNSRNHRNKYIVRMII